MRRLPVTGSNELLQLLDPYIPDSFINERWSIRPVRGPRWRLSAAQLWRVHLLALLTPVHSLNLLCTLLAEQRAWRSFARLRHRDEVPDVRLLHAFRAHVGGAMTMAQPGEGAPSALFRQELDEQVERMHRGQQRQQMCAPELGGAELPTRAAHGLGVPALVDEVVGNEWI